MRCFVALPLPETTRSRLSERVEPLRHRHDRLRWTPPEGWHVTLAFLGEVASPTSAEAAVRAAVAGLEPFELTTTEGGRFGGSVLWLGIQADPPDALQHLARRVRRELGDHGVSVDEAGFRPHVTLARSRRRDRAVESSLVEAVGTPGERWRADRVELWESILGRGPARYEVVASVELVG